MLLRCLGTGSSGNCYLLNCGNEVLVLDCGLPIKQIKKGLNWDISKVVGVLCSHVHLDHSKAVKDFENMGIPIFTPYEQAEKKPQTMKFGSFKVTALPMLDKNMEVWQHTNAKDMSKCPIYGFLVECSKGKLLYVTDCKLCVWNMKKQKINHILLGINFQNDMLSSEEVKTHHVLTGHMSLSTGCELIKANATNALRTVILCHMSDSSCDIDKSIEEVRKTVHSGIKCVVAAAGESVELSQYPF